MTRFFFIIPVLLGALSSSCSFDTSGIPSGGGSCNDSTINGTETDTDCGGDVCAPCMDGKICLLGSDCSSGECSSEGRCYSPEQCTDQVMNGGETDVDCGGAVCTPCEDGFGCLEARDCVSGFCNEEGVCYTPEGCGDGLQNGDETDVDCGGSECAPCAAGFTCEQSSDCESKVCDSLNVCAEASCFDSVMNGDETDINCGGSVCPPCVEGESCLVGTDCDSNICDPLHLCTASSCTDNVTNADETDVDCGGPLCSPCIAGKECLLGSDCLSFICDVTDTCTAASCDDGVINGSEIDTDCGGSSCPACAPGQFCYDNADCITGYCDGNNCVALTSCSELVAVAPATLSGDYLIERTAGPLMVYCHVGTSTYTLKYISGGTATNHKDVNDSCKQSGLILFTPFSSEHFAAARDYALSIAVPTGGNFLGPLGIYNPSDGDNFGYNQWCANADYCCHKRLAGGGGSDTVSDSDCGFTSLVGSAFWASDITTIGEPNGDYDANCWLGITYDTSGNVNHWNDDDCSYSYSSYMCMTPDGL